MSIEHRAKEYTRAKEVMAAGIYPYFRAIESDQDAVVMMHGKKVLMMGSNNYLGLTNHPEVKEAAKRAIDQYGAGCAGSRFLNGTLKIHIELEEKLAEFIKTEAVLIFTTGHHVNLGVLDTLVGRGDYIVMDDQVHASIVDGSRLSYANKRKYKHNDMQALEEVLKTIPLDKVKLIVVDGVFSMEGDIAKLKDIVFLAEKYQCDVMVDDAHSIGVLGPNGDGTAAHFQVQNQVNLIGGTFSKSLASVGGFIGGSSDVIHYLKHHCRSLIFTASPSPANVGAVLKALEILQREPERRQKLWDNTHRMLKALKECGFNTLHSETPIIPIHVGDDLKAFTYCKLLQDEGVFVNPVISPAVEKGGALIRLSLMATHTFEHIDLAVEKLYKVGNMLEVL
ncbi:MAG: aminotransferase class I/II-fold pyridoxal phosphate-dependent enzyme [bacterium]|nr:aminotransferase class I/II-fold pyridoxal phosphate-dependent enzyme [bacterium]